VSVERLTSEVTARAWVLTKRSHQCGTYHESKTWKTEAWIVRVSGRVACDGDTKHGCVLVGSEGRHFALRETLGRAYNNHVKKTMF
jgi:hypothetical protein